MENYPACKVLRLLIIFQVHTRYYASIVAENRATLTNSAETSDIVFDPSIPIAGHVAEGTFFNEDVTWWGSADFVKGMGFKLT